MTRVKQAPESPLLSATELICRPYEPSDREAIRRICCETGHLGDPIDPYFGDREVFADLVTSYYTDYDPSWSFVIEDGSEVVGYLTGCADTRRYRRIVPSIWRRVALKAVGRGVLFRPSTARLTWRMLYDVARERLFLEGYGGDYPSHFHIDLLPQARRRGGGRMLIEAFIAKLTASGSTGVFLETSAENERAVAFFEAMGFEPLDSWPAPGSRRSDGGRLHVLAMGKRLAES